MPNYDFRTLSPIDFEHLLRDLLQKKLDLYIESFKEGKDGGVDLRIARTRKKDWVIQCKRLVQSTFAQLKAQVKKEIPKLKILSPDRYFLCTALPLLPQHKKQLLGLMQPFCKSTEDIFGRDDLNNLLGIYSDVERKHFKLWMCSTNVLDIIFKSEIFNRTALDEGEIELRISMFVTTPAIQRTQKILSTHGYCLIAGIPGIGKSTTAEIVLATKVASGWTAYCVKNASQAIEVLKSGEKQIIYYDDFLGQTSLREKLAKNEEDDIARVIAYCRKNAKTKQFILTTREYLLEQATRIHEKLKRSKIELAKCTVELEDYTRLIRAEILVNHLFFYDIPKKVRNYLIDKGVARRIVEHPNYNPRVIETMCDRFGQTPETPARFAKSFLKFLDDPFDIWRSAFDDQLSSDARNLLICFASISEFPTISNLKTAFTAYSPTENDAYQRSLLFSQSLKELDGTFLRSNRGSLSFHNPSVKDFTDSIIAQEDVAGQILRTAVFYCQFERLSEVVDIEDKIVIGVIERTILSYEAAAPAFAARLNSWIVESQKRDVLKRDLLPTLVRYARECFNESKFARDSAFDLVRLFDFAKKIGRTTFDYDITRVYKMVESSLWEADDYIILEEFLEDLSEGEIEQLGGFTAEQKFVDFAEDKLFFAQNDAESSSDLDQLLESVRAVVDHFDSDVCNIIEAEDKLNELQEMEDGMQDRNEDFRYKERELEEQTSRQIDDTLSSLRE